MEELKLRASGELKLRASGELKLRASGELKLLALAASATHAIGMRANERFSLSISKTYIYIYSVVADEGNA